ncbi:MAG: linear amide C-N hydrolase [Alphaproteobacteria bacterium]|nr:linear amide C-N hydrolase [Alphaproteobacteria bacterium]
MHKTKDIYSVFMHLFAGILVCSGVVNGQNFQPETISFPSFPLNGAGNDPILAVKKISGTEVFCEDGLYLISLSGDFTTLFEKENRKAIDHPMINEPWRFCSVFSYYNINGNEKTDQPKPDSSLCVVMGRNWDNQNVGSILVTWYRPETGYASINFSRSIDCGFPLALNLEEFQEGDQAKRLWLSPFYSMDGINEKGLAVAVTGVRNVEVSPSEGMEQVFMPYLIRLLLDNIESVDGAIQMVQKYIPFDLDGNSLNSHLMISDASGNSAILEYSGGEWHITPSVHPWQALTNKWIFGVPDTALREKCWRYNELAGKLKQTTGSMDPETGLALLREVSQKGTTWSAFYNITGRSIDFHIYQNWNTVFRVCFPDTIFHDRSQ